MSSSLVPGAQKSLLKAPMKSDTLIVTRQAVEAIQKHGIALFLYEQPRAKSQSIDKFTNDFNTAFIARLSSF